MSSLSLEARDVVIPVIIDENDLYGGVLRLLEIIRPNWTQKSIKLKTLNAGITNKLVYCEYHDMHGTEHAMLVRIYGKNTDLFIDRSAEIRNIRRLNVFGLAPEIYGVFENGLAYEFYPGETLTIHTVRNHRIWPMIAVKMAKMHKVNLGKDVPKVPFIWDKITQFLNLIPEPFTSPVKQIRFSSAFKSVADLKVEYDRLKQQLSVIDSPIVFAHNDLLLGNVVYHRDKHLNKETLAFIDYEYAGYCYQGFDIANHFNEFVGLSIEDINYINYPSEQFQMEWIKVYLAEYLNVDYPMDEQVSKVYKEVQQLSLLSHFLWGIWSLVQYEHSDIEFDFGRYAEVRLNRYFSTKDKILEKLPQSSDLV